MDLIIELREKLSATGLDAGADTIVWHLEHHHEATVSRATVARYLAKHGLVVPEPKKRPESSYSRFHAEQPNESWQADFTLYPAHPPRRPCRDGCRAGRLSLISDPDAVTNLITTAARTTA